ncbi:phage terminase endonuclease subunit [Comamonas testosteroni]|uniref:Phage terminase endonuclease subunit n=1 Tax=Comamonas testosteroni TaxID=285 RepID=A0A5A7M601_COMTE|nr:phage terminase small subunit [Comamonas testosteroni]GEQ73222.1 phage terminase endonuclease subunit [Comamonas testosteroni]
MQLTPAQRHRARVLAAKAQAESPFGIEVQGSEYELMMAKLATDKRTLKNMESVQLKRQAKAAMLPDYLPWIDGALTNGKGAKDLVLTTTMVWAIDAGAYGLALRMAAYVVQHSLPLPDQYHRSTAALLMDEFAGAYLGGQWNPIKPDASGMVPDDTHPAEHLTAVDGITQSLDAPDQARAKLYKATAYAMLGKVQTAEEPALDDIPQETLGGVQALLAQALKLDAQSGVKKDMERIERKLRALAAPPQADGATAPAAPAAATATAAPAPRKRATPAKPAAKGKR